MCRWLLVEALVKKDEPKNGFNGKKRADQQQYLVFVSVLHHNQKFPPFPLCLCLFHFLLTLALEEDSINVF